MADDRKGGAAQDGGVGRRPAPSKRPAWAQFTDADRLSLRDEFGVTELQVFWLARSLTSIADYVRRKPRAADVGGELKGLARELAAARDRPARRLAAIDAARKRLKRWQDGARLVEGRSQQAEALGHLGMAYAIVPGPQLDLVGDEPPTVELLGIIAHRLSVAGHDRSNKVPTTAVLLAFAADIAARAFDDRPPEQRRPAMASAEAMAKIVAALKRPGDPESNLAAERLAPVWEDANSPPPAGRFGALARLVLQRVTGRNASAARSVRAYMKSRENSRLAGRPKRS